MSKSRRKIGAGLTVGEESDSGEEAERSAARRSYTRNPKFLMQAHLSYTADSSDSTKVIRSRAGSTGSGGELKSSISGGAQQQGSGMSRNVVQGCNDSPHGELQTRQKLRNKTKTPKQTYTGLAGFRYRLKYIGHTCLFNPAGEFILGWGYLMSVCIMVTVIEGPIVAAYDVRTVPVIVILILIDCLFFCDILVNMLTGYVASNRAIVMDQKRAIKHYLRTWFFVDLAGALPWGIISLWVKESMWIALLKLLRLFSMRHLLDHIQSLNANLLTWIRLGMIFVGWISLMNLLACIWFYIAVHSDGVYPHVTYYNDSAELFVDGSFTEQYTYSFYYIVVTMVTVGYGDITPNTISQIWFANICMIFTGFFDAFIFGYVVMLVSTFYSDNVANIAKNKHILQYIENNNLPKQVERRIWHYTTHKDNLRHRFDVEHVFSGYPPHLLKEIKLYSHFDKVVRLLGTNIPVDVCLRLASRLQWTYCVIHEQWVEHGLFGDHAFYLQRGHMTVFHEDCCVRELTGPADLWYGSDMLFGPKKKHGVTIEATEDCDLFILTRIDLLELMEELPELKDKIKHNLIEMKMEVHELKTYEVNEMSEHPYQMPQVDPYGHIIDTDEERANVEQTAFRNNQDTIVIPAPSTRQILGKMHPRVSVYTGAPSEASSYATTLIADDSLLAPNGESPLLDRNTPTPSDSGGNTPQSASTTDTGSQPTTKKSRLRQTQKRLSKVLEHTGFHKPSTPSATPTSSPPQSPSRMPTCTSTQLGKEHGKYVMDIANKNNTNAPDKKLDLLEDSKRISVAVTPPSLRSSDWISKENGLPNGCTSDSTIASSSKPLTTDTGTVENSSPSWTVSTESYRPLKNAGEVLSDQTKRGEYVEGCESERRSSASAVVASTGTRASMVEVSLERMTRSESVGRFKCTVNQQLSGLCSGPSAVQDDGELADMHRSESVGRFKVQRSSSQQYIGNTALSQLLSASQKGDRKGVAWEVGTEAPQIGRDTVDLSNSDTSGKNTP